ncbi:hypothetical protein NDU88_004196 [Pleurodeles waltl]|uniref:Uncharacterized protein n=1 Tax=Pleurodeles waltl TaxID=8319 RepID=A0AAV7WUY1_PLEWA|nr:hypothetical protein NDU88_004196 [Pleurodeles waltl]
MAAAQLRALALKAVGRLRTLALKAAGWLTTVETMEFVPTRLRLLAPIGKAALLLECGRLLHVLPPHGSCSRLGFHESEWSHTALRFSSTPLVSRSQPPTTITLNAQVEQQQNCGISEVGSQGSKWK